MLLCLSVVLLLPCLSQHLLFMKTKFLFFCRILALDLSDPEVCASAAEKALELFGRVDILINNAGMMRVQPL